MAVFGMGLVPGAAELSAESWGLPGTPGFCLKSSSVHPGILATFQVLGVTWAFPPEGFIQPPHFRSF